MNDALIARLGLDKEAFDAGLKNAVANAAAAQAKMTAIAKKEEAKRRAASGQGSNGHSNRAGEVEDVLRGERRVEHGIGALTTSIVQMDSVSGVATAGVEALHSVFKAPLALGIGIAAAAAGYEKLSEAAAKAKERHEENAKLFRSSAADQGAQHPAEIQRTLGELTIAGDETKKSLESYPTILADFWKTALTGSDSMVAKLMTDQNKIEARKHELSVAMANTIRDEGKAREISLHVSEREGELLKAKAATQAEIARIHIEGAAGNIRAEAMHTQLTDAGAKGSQDLELINAKFDKLERSHALEGEILEIEKAGLDVENKKAEARVKAAQLELANAHTSEAKAEAALKLSAEKEVLESARRMTAERQHQLAITVAIATMQADAGAREMTRLKMESEEIARRMEDSKPDETDKLFAAQAQNQSAQEDLLSAHSERMFELADKMAQSSAGPDQASQMRSIQARATIADSHAEALQANPRATVEQLVEAKDQAAKLREEYEKIKQANADVLRDTQSESQIMYEVLHGHDALAEKLKIEQSYHDRILKAQRDGNTELARALTQQEALAQAQALKNLNKSGKGDVFVPEPGATPQEQNAARLKWLKDKQARGAAERKEGRAGRNGHSAAESNPHAPINTAPKIGEMGAAGAFRIKDGLGQMEDHSFQVRPQDVRPAAPAKDTGKVDFGDIPNLLERIANSIDTVGKDV